MYAIGQWWFTDVLTFVTLEPNVVCHHLVCAFCPAALFVSSLLLSRASEYLRVLSWRRPCASVCAAYENKWERKQNKKGSTHTYTHTPVHYMLNRITQENTFTPRACLPHRRYTQAHINYANTQHYLGKYAHCPTHTHTHSSENSMCVHSNGLLTIAL